MYLHHRTTVCIALLVCHGYMAWKLVRLEMRGECCITNKRRCGHLSGEGTLFVVTKLQFRYSEKKSTEESFSTIRKN